MTTGIPSMGGRGVTSCVSNWDKLHPCLPDCGLCASLPFKLKKIAEPDILKKVIPLNIVTLHQHKIV